MVTQEDCPFCEIVQRDDPDAREVYRDEHVVAFFDLRLFESFRLPEALRAS